MPATDALPPMPRPGIAGPDMVAWLGRIEADLDNLRTALDWAYETNVPVALEMYVALGAYWRCAQPRAPKASIGCARRSTPSDRWRALPSPIPEAERMLLEARVMVASLNMSGYAGWGVVGSPRR